MIDGLLDSVIEGLRKDAPRDAIKNLYKDAQEATVTCECNQNFLNILIFSFCCSCLTSQEYKSLTGVLRIEGRGVKTTV